MKHPRRWCAAVAKCFQMLVASQIDLHAKFGGVVPEVAARAHLESLNVIADEALKTRGRDRSAAAVEGRRSIELPGAYRVSAGGDGGGQGVCLRVGFAVDRGEITCRPTCTAWCWRRSQKTELRRQRCLFPPLAWSCPVAIPRCTTCMRSTNCAASGRRRMMPWERRLTRWPRFCNWGIRRATDRQAGGRGRSVGGAVPAVASGKGLA